MDLAAIQKRETWAKKKVYIYIEEGRAIKHTKKQMAILIHYICHKKRYVATLE